MNSSERIKIVGSNISSIVLACELIDQKVDFNFYPTTKNLGSGWGGLCYNGQLLDLGQRYFELEFENTYKRNLLEFEISLGHRDFVHHVYNLVEKYHSIHPVKVETYFRETIIKCPLETVNLEQWFDLLSKEEKSNVIQETKELDYNQAFNFETIKELPSLKSEYSLSNVLYNSHSNTLNKTLILPFILKFGVPLEKIPYELRRKLWCPIFYRSTVVDVANRIEKFKPLRPHFSITNASTSQLLQTMIKKIKDSSSWMNHELSQQYFSTNFYQDLKSNSNLILATSVDWLANKLNVDFNKEKFEYRVMWLNVLRNDLNLDIHYLSVIEKDIPFFRVSGSSHCTNNNEKIICLEMTDKSVEVDSIIAHLKNMKIIIQSANPTLLKDLSVKLDAPTFTNADAHFKAINKIQDLYASLDLDLCGRVFGKNSFNDQVLLGLKKKQEIINE